MSFPADIDLVSHVQRVLNEVCFGDPDEVEAAIKKNFSPDYVQVSDGNRLVYNDFVAHIRHLRGHLVSGTVEVHEAVRDGDLVADRHTLRAVKVDGSEVVGDCYAFTHYAEDGRILRVNEISRVIGNAADQDLSHAR
jgi:ketosteroid isomerase-like protein